MATDGFMPALCLTLELHFRRVRSLSLSPCLLVPLYLSSLFSNSLSLVSISSSHTHTGKLLGGTGTHMSDVMCCGKVNVWVYFACLHYRALSSGQA